MATDGSATAVPLHSTAPPQLPLPETVTDIVLVLPRPPLSVTVSLTE